MTERLPKRVLAVVERVRKGQRLCKTFINKATGTVEVVFTFEPSGRKAPPVSSEAAIASGLLRPLGDGLFGGDTSQTWIA